MILVDTSIWIDFLRGGDSELARLIGSTGVLCHPMVMGELACGNLPQRQFALRRLRNLPQATVANHDQVMEFIEREQLFGRGIGYVDIHLLASTRIGQARKLWTRDKRLQNAAIEMGLSYET